MTAWQEAKKYGLSLSLLSEISEVPVTTLRDWFKTRPKAFEMICRGAREVSNHSEGCKQIDKEIEQLKLKEQFTFECGGEG